MGEKNSHRKTTTKKTPTLHNSSANPSLYNSIQTITSIQEAMPKPILHEIDQGVYWCYTCRNETLAHFQRTGVYLQDPQAPATSTLYELGCHRKISKVVEASNERLRICADCLTVAWLDSQNERVPCTLCSHRNAGFPPLFPIEKLMVDEHLVKDIKGFRKTLAVPKALIGIEVADAETILRGLYSFKLSIGTLAPIVNGRFYAAILQSLHDTNIEHKKRFGIVPEQLERALKAHLFRDIVAYTKLKYYKGLRSKGLSPSQSKALIRTKLPLLQEIQNNWNEIIALLIDILCWRHQRRLAVTVIDDSKYMQGPYDEEHRTKRRKVSWTDEQDEEMLRLWFDMKNEKEIAQILGHKTERQVLARRVFLTGALEGYKPGVVQSPIYKKALKEYMERNQPPKDA